jgi:hypothetical protein
MLFYRPSKWSCQRGDERGFMSAFNVVEVLDVVDVVIIVYVR